ncbi:MAG: T9SS type A sorting domain-containing protein [Vicingaceae bacterium]|nr:T9SS type A sorting domain-containing protein [Vicingaceae bacterium]
MDKSIQLTKNKYVRLCLDAHQLTDVETLLNQDKTVEDKMSLITMVVNKDQQQAAQLITELRADAAQMELATPNSEKALEIEKFCDYYTVVKDKISISGSFSNLTAADELIIRELAQTNQPIAIKAQNALSFFKGETTERYAEAIVLNPVASRGANNNDASTVNDAQQPLTKELYTLNNYPNPFNENTVLEVTLPEATEGEVVITDVTGKQLKRVMLTETNSQVEVKGEELGYGIFFYSLYINGELVETKKMARMR